MTKSEDRVIQQFRDNKSMELFDKPECLLEPFQVIKLDQYIYDIGHPVWKDVIIKGKKTNYQVSNLGEVRDKNNILKKYQIYDNWYYQVYLPILGSQLVHRLVAIAFIPNPENKPQVNHINGKKGFNWVGNLEWVTAKENAEHAWRTHLVDNSGEKQGSSIYTNDQISKVCELLEDRKLSYKEISRITGVDYKTISEVRTKRSWRSISSKYNIPEVEKNTLYTDDQIINTCKLLEDPSLNHQYISELTGVNINTIKDIMKKTSYRRISDGYNICKRINAANFSPIAKASESQIKEVCRLLEDPYIPAKEIAVRTGVKLHTVYDVMSGKKWKFISNKYDICKRAVKNIAI